MDLLRLHGISLTSKPISPIVLGVDAVLALFDGFYTPSPGALSILNPDSANTNGTKSVSVHALQINISLFNGPTVPQKIVEKHNQSDGDSQQKSVHAEDKEAGGLIDYGLSHPDFSDGHENRPAQILLHADLSDLNAQAIDDAPLLQFTGKKTSFAADYLTDLHMNGPSSGQQTGKPMRNEAHHEAITTCNTNPVIGKIGRAHV